MKKLPWVLACVVLSVGACASRSSTPAPKKFVQVYVSIFGFGDARVGATLIDREGNRTGWNVDHTIDQITGCAYGAGSEDGIPDENAPEDTIVRAPSDTLPNAPRPTPKYHYFSIQDSMGTPGLLREGGCELRLDPEVPGHVMLAITGSGIGMEQCQDTTSVNVKPDVPSRWRLSWNARGNRCDVKITRVGGRQTRR
jgi:hypothetical protein